MAVRPGGGRSPSAGACTMQMDSILAPFIPHGVSDCVHADIGVDSTRRDWRENVLRCRETLELLAIVAIVEHASNDTTSTPQEPCDSSAGASVLACHGTSRRYLIFAFAAKRGTRQIRVNTSYAP